MKTSIKLLSVLFFLTFFITSCSEEDTLDPIAHIVKITAEPTTAISGDETVTITSTITDVDAPNPTPTYTYKWYKSTTATAAGEVIADATSSTFKTPNATTLTTGTYYYYVEVKDGTSETFNPVKSNVITVVAN